MPALAAAFFDVDGTLARTTIVNPLIWYQRAHLGKLRFLLWAAGLMFQVPQYVCIDRISRIRVNILFYRRYAGLNAEEVAAWHHQTFAQTFQPRLFSGALDCLRQHKQQAHRLVLVTGGLDFVMRPLAEHIGADDVIAARLVQRNGTFTGEVDGSPIADEIKGERIRTYAQKYDIALEQSFAYSDSYRDLSMLECVGHPIAANPDRRLRRLAQQRHWPIVTWR